MRRVVVTGMGMVSPLGLGVERSWRRLIAGESGIRTVAGVDAGDLPCRIAAQVPQGSAADGGFTPDDWVPAKERKKMGRFIALALAAAAEALDDARWRPEAEEERRRTGVMIGSGIGGLAEIAEGAVELHERGPRRISPFFIPANLINLASGHVSIRHGLKGPNHGIVTACSTGAHAIGEAARSIALGTAEVMVAGGTEAAVCRLSIAGFCASRALSTGFNDDPETASRPWDRRRDGFVMGEGAGVLVLEERDHALRRGAAIHAELLGYGASGDAHHITAPAEDGDGAFRAMEAALAMAGLAPDAVDYVNAHATSTPAGDPVEIAAVRRLFGDHAANGLSMSSTKSAVGHLLGAAGSVEAIFSILALRHQIAPPTLNLEDPSADCRGIDLVPRRARPRPIRTVLSNSFGFGGTNAALVFGPP
ncbi:beta-ketoacyl-ACP synthase II [Azospirillum sp. ST 5-10]|uniref:beta-ketoacyl-ACP synthase II n=1 Tax=unclassified Azospirillum TaxID=2630922 RepID=UPI003F4A3F2E